MLPFKLAKVEHQGLSELIICWVRHLRIKVGPERALHF